MTPNNVAWVTAARRKFGDEGNIEIDNDAPISMNENTLSADTRALDRGAYVQAWVWVTTSEASACLREQESAGSVPRRRPIEEE